MWSDKSRVCAGHTSLLYRFGPDRPITRASVALVCAERAKAKKPALSDEQLVREFVAFPTARHLARVARARKSRTQGQHTGTASPSPV